MNEENRNNILRGHCTSRIIYYCSCLQDLLFPLLAWTIEFVRNKITVSFSGIGEIHTHKSTALFDGSDSVVLVHCGAYLLDIQRIKDNRHLLTRSVNGISRMNAMADFAKKIGEGNYHSTLEHQHRS